MSEECTHNCSTCGKKGECSDKASFLAPPNANSKIGRVIAVASGKGGVGKSFATTMLAVEAMRMGFKVGILDADITGPSIPKAFGLTGGTFQDELGIAPQITNGAIKIMSLNMLVENPSDPVVWRGPVIAGAVKQFWSDVHWGELDILFVDMPPGTGDVPLTVFQSLPVDGVVIVSSPQKLVEMIVSKSVKMAEMMKKPILGLVENMSYLECPDCGKRIEIFGPSQAASLAEKFSIPAIVKIPVNADFASFIDAGKAEEITVAKFAEFTERILTLAKGPKQG